MYAKVALLLLGFAVAAFGETCTCSGLKACLDAKKDLRNKTHTKCASRCVKKLPGDINQVQQCLKDKSDAMEKLKENQIDCLLNPIGGVCSAPRARRQSDPHNFFVQPGPADFQPASNRGRWIQPAAQASAGASISDADDLLKSYHDCMHSCSQELHPEKGEGLASGANQAAVDPIGRHIATMGECQLAAKCNVETSALAKVAQTCQSGSEDELNYKLDVNLSFCRCMQGALQKTDAEMNCSLDGNGGRSKGGRND